ncbi:MAG: GRRM system radical SAM/SPASM domain protein [Akkermansiaceae bacterium]|nr:GRRM system radical SAM/SPASM domain protein [Akkermansiaceae bacterium]
MNDSAAENPIPSGLCEQLRLGVLVIQPSPFCNIDCDYCYLPNRTSARRMEFAILEKTMERVFDSGLAGGPFTLLWHAGEPLAVPVSWYEEAFSIIGRFPRAGEWVEHTFQSNGTLIDDAWCEFIARHGVNVGLSLDGPAFIHDFHRKTRRGEGTHARALRGAERLRRHGIPFGVIAVISRFSLDYPDEIYGFFRDLGIDGVGFNIEEIEGAHAASSFDALDDPEGRVRAFLERVYALNKRDGFPLQIREFENARQNILAPGLNRAPNGRYYNLETEPLGMINVDCFGNFSTFSPELLGQPADGFGDFTFGNVTRDSVFDATEHPAFLRMLADIENGNRRCAATCAYWEHCGGASPSNKFFENGAFDSAETRHCRCMIQMPMDIVLADLEAGLDVPARTETFPATVTQTAN